MGKPRVFISHAGPDSVVARTVSHALEAKGLETVLDHESLRPGDNVVAFMENALATSDYYLLLWSAVAAARAWVREEWQAALHRSVAERRAFLVVGRLDDHQLPMLLAPRLNVRLHPSLEPGLSTIVDMWHADRRAEERSAHPVAGAPRAPSSEVSGEQVYVTSDLFGITCPWHADLHAPAGVLLDQLKRDLQLPTEFDHKGRISARFEYHLLSDNVRLSRAAPLGSQGVAKNSVLVIECEINMMASATAISGSLGKARFRSAASVELRRVVGEYLIARINDVGLGPR